MLTVKRRQTVCLGTTNVRLYHVLPYMTLITASKAATVAFVTVAISAPTTGRGSIALVRGLRRVVQSLNACLVCRNSAVSQS